jgi:hypothetical protein
MKSFSLKRSDKMSSQRTKDSWIYIPQITFSQILLCLWLHTHTLHDHHIPLYSFHIWCVKRVSIFRTKRLEKRDITHKIDINNEGENKSEVKRNSSSSTTSSSSPTSSYIEKDIVIIGLWKDMLVSLQNHTQISINDKSQISLRESRMFSVTNSCYGRHKKE